VASFDRFPFPTKGPSQVGYDERTRLPNTRKTNRQEKGLVPILLWVVLRIRESLTRAQSALSVAKKHACTMTGRYDDREAFSLSKRNVQLNQMSPW